MALKSNLFKHQIEAVKTYASRPYFGLLFSPGLGKTLTALAIIHCRKAATPDYTALVVCPATLIENIYNEVHKHTDMSAVMLTGTRAQRLKKLAQPSDIYIINYEGSRILTEDLIKKKFNLIICDESHALKDSTSLQSKACFKIAQSCPHRIIMTGTLVLNNPLDIFGQFRILTPDIFGLSYYRFRSQYAILGGFLGKQIIKYINMPRLKTKVLHYATMKSKEECLDLPDKLYETVYLDLPDAQRKMYNQLRDDFIAATGDSVITAPVVLTRLIRFSQITAGFYKNIEGVEHAFPTNPKQDALVTWIKDNQQKIVVFCRFRKEIALLEARFVQEDISFVSIHGDVHNRIELVDKFNNDPSIQVLIGQLDVAGQGINLTGASYCAFLSNNYSYGDRLQACDRIHRIGQTKNCTYIDFVYKGTIDQSILKILDKKESLSNLIKPDLIRMV